MAKAFWICLTIFLVGGLISFITPAGQLPVAVDSYFKVLATVGVITVLLGVVLLGRWAFAGVGTMFNEVRAQAGALPVANALNKGRSFALAIDKRLIAVAVAAVGAFFFASGFQSGGRNLGRNWAGQFCAMDSTCVHPEWIAVGVGLVGLAVYLWTLHKP